MLKRNIASASWGDHLTFGEGDGLLDNPDSLYKRMEIWKNELGISSIHWRQGRTSRFGNYRYAKNYRKAVNNLKNELTFDGQKGSNMNFRKNGQLRQLILLVENDKIITEAPVRGVAKPPTLDSLGILDCKN